MIKYRLLFWGDSPSIKSGLGIQGKRILECIDPEKFEIYILSINHPRIEYGKLNWHYIPLSRADGIGWDKLTTLLTTELFQVVFPYLHWHHIWKRGGFKVLTNVLKNLKTKPYWMWYLPIEEEGIQYETLEWFKDNVNLPIVFADFAYDLIQKTKSWPNLKKIEHQMDFANFRPLPDQDRPKLKTKLFGLKPDTFLVSNMNSNSPRKDIDRTLRAFAKFKEKVPNSFLYLHSFASGDGGPLSYYGLSYGLKPGKDFIVWEKQLLFHPLEDSRMNEIYNASDLVVSTSFGEGLGLSALEAFATKTAFCGPNNTSFPELIGKKEERGYLAECGSNSTEWMRGEATAILVGLTNVDSMVSKMLEAYDNPAIRKQKADNAFKWVKDNFAQQKTIGKWKSTFAKVYDAVDGNYKRTRTDEEEKELFESVNFL